VDERLIPNYQKHQHREKGLKQHSPPSFSSNATLRAQIFLEVNVALNSGIQGVKNDAVDKECMGGLGMEGWKECEDGNECFLLTKVRFTNRRETENEGGGV
jgi:hypothetical protein